MPGDDTPTLSVGFAIDTGGSADELTRLAALMNSTEAKVLREAKSIEQATSGMVNLGGATASISMFGSAATKAGQDAQRAYAQAEKGGESMVRQVERQIEVFGKTASEIRNMRAEAKAAAADAQGLTELAARLRETNAQLVAMESEASHAAGGMTRMSSSGMEMMHVARASSDAFAAGAPPMQIFTMEIGRVAEAAALAGGGAGALGKFGAFLGGPWGMALTFGVAVLGPLVAKLFENDDAAKAAAEGMKKFQERQSDIGNFIDATTGKLVEQNRTLVLNAALTRQAQIAANDKAITEGREAAFKAARSTFTANAPSAGVSTVGAPLMSMNVIDPDVQRAITASKGNVDALASSIAHLAQTTRPDLKPLALQTSSLGGAAIIATRENENLRKELRALGGDTTALAGNTTSLINKQVELTTATTPLEKAQAQLAIVKESAAAADKVGGAALVKYRTELIAATNAVNAAQAAQKAASAARRDANKEATHQAALARAAAKHDDQLATRSAAIEAEIKNTYALAAAYGVSGGASLIAQARLKAETAAIKEKGAIEAAVDQQVRLSVAQGVASAAQSTAALKEQTAAQKQVNDLVAAGIVPAAQAAELVRDRLADQKLVSDAQAAQQLADEAGARGNVKRQADMAAQVKIATDALTDQRAAREANNAAMRDASYLAAMDAGKAELDRLKLEGDLIGANTAKRVHDLAVQQASQEAAQRHYTPAQSAAYVKQQVSIADTRQADTEKTAQLNAQLQLTAQLASSAGDAMAKAFGSMGSSIGDVVKILGEYGEKQEAIAKQVAARTMTQAQADKASGDLQLSSIIGITDAAKNMFDQHSEGYAIMAAAEKALTIAQLARTAVDVAGGAARMFSFLGPFAFPAVAAMMATMAALGFKSTVSTQAAPTSSADLQKAAGTGTVLGSVDGKSASIAHSLDLVAKNTDGLLAYSNPMLAALKTINASIGAMTAAVAKQIGVSGSLYDTSKLNIGSSGSAGFLGLFSSSTTRTLYDAGITLAATTVGNIVAQGISGQTYQIVQQVKKSSGFLGIGGGTSTTYQTTTGALPTDITDSIRSVIGALENGIVTAAGQIGVTGAKAMLDNFQVSIGQLSFNGLDAQGISDELNAVFSKVGDQMVQAILPDVARFQTAGEGLFETLERVASTTAAVDAEFRKMGVTTTSLGIDVDMAVAGMFDSVSDFTSAADAYFKTYYSVADQAKAQAADMQAVFDALGVAMPSTLEGFRQLVEAQNLTTAAGQSTYATLLKVAPAFADLQAALNGAKSAADALNERDGLLNQLWQLQGDTASIRAAQLATLDPSNRALQQQIYAVQDAQDAAKAASDLADAWKSVGQTILDEINRIRGLDTSTGGGSFASLMAQFNAATTAARAGDQDQAKLLPGLSQSLLTAAQAAATSRQELDRVQAETAASLQTTYDAIRQLGTTSAASTNAALLAAAATTSQATSTPQAANDDLVTAIEELKAEVARMHDDNNKGHAATASGTNKTAKILDQVTAPYGGQAIGVGNASR